MSNEKQHNYPNRAADERGEKESVKSRVLKYGLSVIFMIAIIRITFSILMRNYSWTEIRTSLAKTNPFYIAAGFLLMVLYVWCLARSLKILLDRFIGEKVPFRICMQTMMIGFYFNNITPSASGGQPMEVYFLHRRGVQAAHSSLIFIVLSYFFYIVMFIYAGLAMIFSFDLIIGSLGHVKYFLILGILFNGLVGVGCYLIIFKPKLLRSMVKGIMNFLIKIRLIRNPRKHFRKISGFLRNYENSSDKLKRSPRLMMELLGLCLLQVAALFIVPFVVCMALGAPFSWKLLWESFSLQSVLYMAVSAMPTPGAVGVTESGFVTMFESILPESEVMAAMILTRVVNLYGFLLIAAAVTLWSFTISVNRPKLNLSDE